ncbi:MAG: hypothetical protein V1707_03775 [bacterium]
MEVIPRQTKGVNERERKALIWTLGVVSVVVFIVAIINLKQSIAKPFAFEQALEQPDSELTPSELPVDPSQLSDQQIAVLSKQDTDGDGLSDFEELYGYKTSPYIEDTDSDGVSDGAEVKANSDPLCPAGKNCFDMATGSVTAEEQNIEQPDKDYRNLTVTEIKELLIQSGASAESVNKLSDEQLVENYKKAFDQLAGQTAAGQGILPDDLSKATPDQIKMFLKAQGATDEQLKAYNDEQLQKLFQETLKSLGKQQP